MHANMQNQQVKQELFYILFKYMCHGRTTVGFTRISPLRDGEKCIQVCAKIHEASVVLSLHHVISPAFVQIKLPFKINHKTQTIHCKYRYFVQ